MLSLFKLLFNITEISKFIKIFELLPLDIIIFKNYFFVNSTNGIKVYNFIYIILKIFNIVLYIIISN